MYINKQYDQIKADFQKLGFIDKCDPFILHQSKLADMKLIKKDRLVHDLLHDKRDMKFNFFLAFVLYFVWKKYYEYYYNPDGKKPVQEEPRENSIWKLLDPEGNFEINFASNIEERIDNVKGIDEVREEIDQLIRMIKNPKKYIDAGAKLHKGILLCGKPGTGKTLLARAIAGESGVNFIFLTGSDFDEVFVGVGAARIRKLFQIARKNKPCIIFIDEIDSLLTKSRRMSMEHSSSRATINQFLAEMDGFEKMDQVFLIGATNHEKDLDPAAMRPGRFDKRIHINVPDEDGRTQIINHYLNKIKLNRDALDAKFIARMTPGFTGAEIENLVNMSIISAVSEKKQEVTMDDIGEARDRILMGISRKYYKTSDRKRFVTAIHEGGHTLVCYRNPLCKRKLHKLTIVPRGMAAGVTFTLHDEEALNSKEEYISHIDLCMGGQVAEEIMFGKDQISAGCSSDLQQASGVAKSMVKRFGMYSDKAGYIYVEDKSNNGNDTEKVSEKYKQSIDETVAVVLKESRERVEALLKKDANDLKLLAQKVFIHDTLNIEDIEDVMEGRADLIKRPKVRNAYIETEV